MRSGRPRRLVCGVGLNDYNGFTTSTKGRIPEYDVWRTIIRRCYSKEHTDKFPTYKDAFVDDFNWDINYDYYINEAEKLLLPLKETIYN